MIEIPAVDAVQLALAILAALDGGPSQVYRCVSVQPLLAESCKEGGEERSGETGEKDRLNLNHRAWGTRPLRWDSGNITTEGGVVCPVDEDTEESGGLTIGVLLELGVD